MHVKAGTSASDKAAASYMRLVREYTLHPIRDDDDYDRAAEVLHALGEKAERGEKLDPGEREYEAVLEQLMRQYDDEHVPLARDRRPAPERLRYLLREAGLQQKDLAAIMDVTRSAVSMILSGERQLTLDQVRKLSAHFRLSADYFV